MLRIHERFLSEESNKKVMYLANSWDNAVSFYWKFRIHDFLEIRKTVYVIMLEN